MSETGFGLFEPRTVPHGHQPSWVDAVQVDPDAPLGSHRRPLGNPEHAARSYLLGLRCTCGTTSLAYSRSVDANESITCPGCTKALL